MGKKRINLFAGLSAFVCDARNLRSACRDDVVHDLFSYVTPLIPHYSRLGARLYLSGAGVSYELNTVPMEAFARPLWGLAPFWAGGGAHDELAKLYRSGLASGTDPLNHEYWGACRDNDQKFVEMAAIAYALLLAPQVLWEPLSDRNRMHVAAWLKQINEYMVWDNNWLFFPVLVNLALRNLGMSWNQDVMNYCLDLIESEYFGGGWYTDGPDAGANANTDYYNPFAFHFYGLIYAIFAWDDDRDRCERFVSRSEELASDFIRWFSDRGESIPYGRSLTYRFAQSAFFSIALLAASRGIPIAIDIDQAKGIVLRNLSCWRQLPTTDNAGILQVGYHYPNLHMQEGYNAPGSPMWAFKAFALLAIPDDDALWVSPVVPLDIEDGVYPTIGRTMLLGRSDGEATLYTGGRVKPRRFTHCEEKYCKFAYSSRWGFSVSVSPYSLKESAPDSMLAFEVDGMIYVRRRSESISISDGSLVSEWSPCSGVHVRTWLFPSGQGHERIHDIESEIECVAYDCGFAVPAESIESAEGICEVESTGDVKGEKVAFRAEPNTNLMTPKSVIHAVRYVVHKGSMQVRTKVYEH